MWERNAFNSGSVNFADNCHMISNGVPSNESSPTFSVEAPKPKPQLTIIRNGSSSCNSSYKLTPQNGQQRTVASKVPSSHQMVETKRPKPVLTHSASYASHSSNTTSHATNHATNHPTSHSTDHRKNFNQALYKTELCRQYCETGRCDYAEKCLFAHGKHELKQISNYRTKVCLSWVNGFCQFGSNCMFIHPPSPDRYRKGSPQVSSKNGYHRATKMARTTH